jgi:DNA polymerase III epsilon subunit-like protein
MSEEKQMGEYADAIIDGESCQMCGIPIYHGEGFPTYCSVQCAKDHGADQQTIKALRRVLIEIQDEG